MTSRATLTAHWLKKQFCWCGLARADSLAAETAEREPRTRAMELSKRTFAFKGTESRELPQQTEGEPVFSATALFASYTLSSAVWPPAAASRARNASAVSRPDPELQLSRYLPHANASFGAVFDQILAPCCPLRLCVLGNVRQGRG